jgi:hypothetical protein
MDTAAINQWIDNDEGLYRWWKSSKLNKRAFIKANRQQLVAAIKKMVSGQQPMHYLRYGGR